MKYSCKENDSLVSEGKVGSVAVYADIVFVRNLSIVGQVFIGCKYGHQMFVKYIVLIFKINMMEMKSFSFFQLKSTSMDA